MKKLYKSERDQIITGVIGGLGEYFSIDPTVLRIGFVVLVLITGIFPGVIAYIIAYFIIPETPHQVSTLVTPPPMKTPEEPKVEVKEEAPQPNFGHSMVTPEEATLTVDELMESTQKETIDGEPLATHESETKENSTESKNPTV